VDTKNYCAEAFVLLKQNKGVGRKKIKCGLYQQVIKRASARFDVPVSNLKVETTRTRTKPGRKFKYLKPGPLSSMAGVEAHLLKCVLLRGEMRQPVSCAERLELASSFIQDTVAQDQLIN
jgi:hypothetical protein